MKYDLLFGKSAFCLPGSAVDYIAKASQTDLRVLMALGSGRFADENALASHIGEDVSAVCGSLEFWRGTGVLEYSATERVQAQKKPSKAPEVTRDDYTSDEINKKCDENPTLRETIDMCQSILGKTFTKTEISCIVYLSDHLRFDDEYIMMLCQHCKSKDKASLRYVEKLGVELYGKGITSVKELDIYIKNETKKQDTEYKIRKLFGIGERALAPKEREFLTRWLEEWKFSYEIIEKAYNIMVVTIERPTFAYENGILDKWREAGCKNIEDVEGLIASQQKKAPQKPSKKAAEARETSFDLDEFFDLAVQRGAGRADGKKEE